LLRLVRHRSNPLAQGRLPVEPGEAVQVHGLGRLLPIHPAQIRAPLRMVPLPRPQHGKGGHGFHLRVDSSLRVGAYGAQVSCSATAGHLPVVGRGALKVLARVLVIPRPIQGSSHDPALLGGVPHGTRVIAEIREHVRVILTVAYVELTDVVVRAVYRFGARKGTLRPPDAGIPAGWAASDDADLVGIAQAQNVAGRGAVANALGGPVCFLAVQTPVRHVAIAIRLAGMPQVARGVTGAQTRAGVAREARPRTRFVDEARRTFLVPCGDHAFFRGHFK